MSFELYDETDFDAVRHLLPDSVMEMVGLIGAEPTAFWAVQNLAQRHHLTDRTVWDILKKTDNAPPPESRQISLL